MKRKGYRRLLFSYLPIFFFTTTAIIFLSVLSASELSKKEAIHANEVFAEHVMQMIDHTMRSIEQQIIKEVQTNDKLARFYAENYNGASAMTLYEISNLLREWIVNVPMIDSVYLVRSSDLTILSNHFMTSVKEFEDRDFIMEALNQHTARTYRWTDIRSYKVFENQPRPIKVVTLVKQVPLLSGEQGIIAVNVQTSAIENMMEDLAASSVNFIRLLDRQGHPILGHETKGKVLTSKESGYTGWKIESGLVGGRLPVFIFSYSSQGFALNLLLIGIGLAWMLVVTRRNYRPIEAIVARIDAYAAQKTGPLAGQDEYRFIETALDDLVERSINYQKQRENDLIYRKRIFFKELVEGASLITPEQFQAEMRLLGFQGHIGQIALAAVELDKYAEFSGRYGQRDQYLLKFALGSVIAELFQKDGITVWMEWTTASQLSVMVHLPDTADDIRFAEQIFENVLQWVNEHLAFTVTIGLSSLAGKIDDVPGLHEEALEALKYKPVLGGNRIIRMEAVKICPQGEIYKHLNLLRSVGRKYRLGDAEWEPELKQMFRECADGLLTRDNLSAILHNMIYHLQREMMEQPPEIQKIWNDETLPLLNRAVERLDTLEELERDLLSILKTAAGRMEQWRESRNHDNLMLRIKAFTHEHYSNPDLCLTYLGCQFDLNAKYISQMFKDKLGINFLDYLSAVRIGHAEKLLTETDKPIQEIGAMVGYTNARSFLRVFKKVTGVTPGEYRKK
ncbi:Arabinose operon regulatory protein [Chlamydia abortus]|nr:Arabinose operon regulatory protein [Chlamydia abortus]